ncbi:putative palmitoyltransferase ZDHHC16 [Acipenser ruthenus]|uniref:Palmitoyltransferase n=1 Tax=Acipenser ruthenus TaxID=7906 RepID=A0A444UP09_ACIRT|nr:putative palmitoyltransferase ZDHHC16 [Acipenser ruthenus]
MQGRTRLFACAMRLFLRCFRLGQRRGRSKLLKRAGELWSYGKLCAKSLFYNSFTNSDVIIDSLFEPIYWLVDHVTRWFGVVTWLNNCVGHFNHRYFFSFCLFMTMGCLYCSISSRDMFIDAYNAVETYYQTPPPPFTFKERVFHKCIIYLWVLCSSVALALGGLTLWHATLISRGETSIERHINHKEKHRLEKKGKSLADSSAPAIGTPSLWRWPDLDPLSNRHQENLAGNLTVF